MKIWIACLLLAAGCKKKADDAPAPGSGSAAAPPSAHVLPAMGIPECDALDAIYVRFTACARITATDRDTQKANVEQLKAVVKGDKAAAANACQGQGATLEQLIETAGC